MAMRYVILLYLLTIVKTDTSSNTEKNVRETVNEEVTLSPDIGLVRVARHPKLHQIVNPSHFDYASITQQDPQKMRYAQQQEVDSYVRAYRLQQQERRPVLPRKQSPKNSQMPTIAHRESMANNIRRALKQNIHSYPTGDTLSEQEMKVADPKYPTRSSNTFSNSDKSYKAESNHQKLTAVRGEEKVPKKNVGEKFLDQETDASDQRESRVYVGTEDLLNSAQYGAPLSANYLAKPMYVLANPQLQLDPQLFAQGLASYALPENHLLRAEGFESASKTDLDALNALLGKAPTDQLQGLNHLLGQQVPNLQESFPVLPTKQALVDFKELAPQSEALVGLKDLVQNQQIVDLKDLVQQHQTNIGLADLVQQTHANIELKDLIQQTQLVPEDQVYIQPEGDIGLKNHTPIREEIADFANTQSKPNVKIEVPQVAPKIQNNIDQQLELARESKSVYGNDDDNVSISTKSPLLHRIKRDIPHTTLAPDFTLYEEYPSYDDKNNTDQYFDYVTNDYWVEFDTTTTEQYNITTEQSNRRVYVPKQLRNHIAGHNSKSQLKFGEKIEFAKVQVDKEPEPSNVIVINNHNNGHKSSHDGHKHKGHHSHKHVVQHRPRKVVKNNKRRVLRINKKINKVDNIMLKLRNRHLIQ